MYPYRTKPIRLGPFTTSKIELNNLLKAWLAISIAFGIILPSIVALHFKLRIGFFYSILISALTVGTAFLVHEVAHKLVAQHYGCFAEFRSFDSMLILAIVFAFIFGIVFAAPGAVMIAGPVGKRRNGKISAAGPSMNIILSLLFFGGYVMYPNPIFFIGYLINTWIALFNMIPFWNFDGKKIFNWNKAVYTIMVILAFSLMFSQSLIG